MTERGVIFIRTPPFNPYIALIIGVISISTSAIFVKMASAAPASIIAAYRLFFAVLFMAPVIIVSYPRMFTNIRPKEWGVCIGAGICLALHFGFWFESLRYTSVASSVVLVSLQPVFAFLGTYLFFTERFSARSIISMCIVVIGSVTITWGDFQLGGQALIGDALALMGAIAMTGYFLFGQQARKKMDVIPYTFLVYGISALLLIGYNIVLQVPFFPYPTNHWTIFFLLAIIPTFLGHSIFNWALKWVSTSTVSMASVCEPIGATLLAYIFLHEHISWEQWLGGSIVLIGLLLFVASTTRKCHVTISERNRSSSLR